MLNYLLKIDFHKIENDGNINLILIYFDNYLFKFNELKDIGADKVNEIVEKIEYLYEEKIFKNYCIFNIV